MYRATVVQRVASLRVLDNKEVSAEERERVDCLFGLDSRTSGHAPPPPRPPLTSRSSRPAASASSHAPRVACRRARTRRC